MLNLYELKLSVEIKQVTHLDQEMFQLEPFLHKSKRLQSIISIFYIIDVSLYH